MKIRLRALRKFDFVLANPPFNVDDVNIKRIESDKRFNTYGIPRNKTKLKKKDQGRKPFQRKLSLDKFICNFS